MLKILNKYRSFIVVILVAIILIIFFNKIVGLGLFCFSSLFSWINSQILKNSEENEVKEYNNIIDQADNRIEILSKDIHDIKNEILIREFKHTSALKKLKDFYFKKDDISDREIDNFFDELDNIR